MIWRWFTSLLLLVASAPVWALDTVTLQLKWEHSFQFAGYYAAKAQGYYREAGLDVQILPARPELNSVDEVASGRAQYGVGTSSLLLERQAGKPLVVLGVIYQHSPWVLIARQDEARHGIRDLIGKPVMLEPQSEELEAFLRRESVKVEQLELRPHTFSVDDLVEGRVAAMTAYIDFEPFELEKRGVEYRVFSPQRAGIDFYGDNLFTSAREVREHPERVEAFREASMRGWEYAMSHRDEIIDLILTQYAPDIGRDFLQYQVRSMSGLIRNDLIEIGYMTTERWRHIADTYAGLGLLPQDYSLDGFFFQPPAERALNKARQNLVIALTLICLGCLILGYAFYANYKLEKAQKALKQSEARFRMLTEQMKDVVWALDVETWRFTYLSPSVKLLRGVTAEEALASNFGDSLTPASKLLARKVIEEEIAKFKARGCQESDYVTTELEQVCKDGSTIWTEVISRMTINQETGHMEIQGVTRDISVRHKQREQILHMAQHDQLTGLANRALFSHHFETALAVARREGGRLALVYLDLDHFKPVNDNLGHAVGDRLLQVVAQRMTDCLRESDIVARIGGDEFMILLHGVEVDHAALQVAEKVRDALSQAFFVDENKLLISCSLGIAFFPEHGRDSVTLSRNADYALYAAKRAGRNAIRLYDGTENSGEF